MRLLAHVRHVSGMIVLGVAALQVGCGESATFGGVGRAKSSDRIESRAGRPAPGVDPLNPAGPDVPELPGETQALACAITADPPGPVDAGTTLKVHLSVSGPVTGVTLDGSETSLTGGDHQVVLEASKTFKGVVHGAAGLLAECELAVVAIPLPIKRSLKLTGKTSSKPVDIVFVLDNSLSMREEIDRMRNSIKLLPERLNAESIDYTLRVLPMSAFGHNLRQTDMTGQKVSTPNYRKGEGESANAAYDAVKIFDRTTFGQIESDISSLAMSQIVSEPGICLAFDYYNYLSNRPDPSSAMLGRNTHFVVMSDERNNLQWEVENNRTGAIESSAELHCPFEAGAPAGCREAVSTYYTWYPYTYNAYVYRGTYEVESKGVCQNRGHAGANIDVYKLTSDVGCRTSRYSCTDNNSPTEYRCQANAEPIFSSTNYSGKSVCAEVAQKFVCPIIVDGAPSTKIVARGSEYAGCTPDYSGAIADTVPNGAAGARSCVAYSCTPTQFAQAVVSEATKNSNTTRYTSCSVRAGEFDYKSKYSFTTSQGAVTAISGSCVAPAVEATMPNPVTASNVCQSELTALGNLPAGVTATKTGVSANTMQTRNYNESVGTTPRTQAEYIAWANPPANSNHLTFTPSRRVITFYRPAALTVAEAASYPELVDLGAQTNVRETDARVTAFRTAVGANNVGPYATERVEANGVRCRLPGTPIDKPLPPTPENFTASLAAWYPERSVVWHSLVNLDGQACSDSGDQIQEKGEGYIELSTMTGGVVEDICSASFDDFIKRMAEYVAKEVDTAYPLEGLDTLSVSKVMLKRGDRVLVEGEDYKVDSDRLVLLKKEDLAIDDEVEVTYLSK